MSVMIEQLESRQLFATPVDGVVGNLSLRRPKTDGLVDWASSSITRVPEATEETVGGGIRINGSDPLGTDDDLLQLEMARNSKIPVGYSYIVSTDSDAIQIHTQESGNSPLLTNRQVNLGRSKLPGTFYVEWKTKQRGAANITFSVVRSSDGLTVVLDKVRVYTFSSMVYVIGGLNQVPVAQTDSNYAEYGTYRIGRDLYAKGYDVHFWSERAIAAVSGQLFGGMIDELKAAYNDRLVRSFVPIGYSYGGGAVYNLLANLPSSLSGLTVPLAVYIDANIQNSAGDAVTVPPPRALKLVNYYQDSNYSNGADFLSGVDVGTGANPLRISGSFIDVLSAKKHLKIDDVVADNRYVISQFSSNGIRV